MMDYFKKTSVNRQTKKILSYVLMTVIGIILIIPLLWMVFTSLKPMEEIVRYPPTFFPEKIVWENYLDTIAAFPFWRYARNTLFITVLVVIGNALSNSFIAYGFAKLDFPGKKLMFALVLSTMMIPWFVTMIPQYVLFSKIGWVGTYLPLIVPSFFGNAFNIFLMRQFYLSINSFNAAWNDFLGPLLYIQDQEKYTLQIGLQVFQNQATTQWNYLMAGATLVLIPTILLFFFAQRYFIEGMDLTGGSKG
ncbi:carbohydrate ABC transporter permease [Enterococcus faecium]|uniref:carbohydrate ABC transporter permease n=1 Tax=Enterococcus faecium TaxID=1352 RepID=UPI0034E934A0